MTSSSVLLFHGTNSFDFDFSYAKEIAIIKQQYNVEEFEFVDPPLVLDYKTGVKMLRDVGIEMGFEDDLSTPNEKLLGRLVKKMVKKI